MESWHKEFNGLVNFANSTFEHLFTNLQVEQGKTKMLLNQFDSKKYTHKKNEKSLKKYNRIKKIAKEPYSDKRRLKHLGLLAVALMTN